MRGSEIEILGRIPSNITIAFQPKRFVYTNYQWPLIRGRPIVGIIKVTSVINVNITITLNSFGNDLKICVRNTI